MKKSTKALLAVVTGWPAVYMAFFFLFVLVLYFSFLSGRPSLPGNPQHLLRILFPVHLGTMALLVALGTFYIYHLFKNDHIAANKKPLWALVILMGNVIAMPVYWYFYIWRDESDFSGTKDDYAESSAQSWLRHK
jgi:hypothetical protein